MEILFLSLLKEILIKQIIIQEIIGDSEIIYNHSIIMEDSIIQDFEDLIGLEEIEKEEV